MTNLFISLVLTTYSRFDTFLKHNLEHYLQNPYIHEIIIYDDCSDDYEKIKNIFHKEIALGKIKVYQQKVNRGPLRNKIDAIQKASCDWICLMDSDNFCNIDYFDALENYWNTYEKNIHTIYMPQKALPNFDFTYYTTPVTKDNWNQLHLEYAIMLNSGNYVFHKDIIPYILPIEKDDSIKGYVEVKYMNRIWVRDGNITIQVIPNMYYHHTVHSDSFWIKNSDKMMQFYETFNWDI